MMQRLILSRTTNGQHSLLSCPVSAWPQAIGGCNPGRTYTKKEKQRQSTSFLSIRRQPLDRPWSWKIFVTGLDHMSSYGISNLARLLLNR